MKELGVAHLFNPKTRCQLRSVTFKFFRVKSFFISQRQSLKDPFYFTPVFININVSKNALTGVRTPKGKVDLAADNGMSRERFAKRMLKAIKSKKQEVHIASAKEKLGVYLKQFFSKLLSVLVRKMSVT